ncbi:YARHG domain-containing protein [Butyrivibrio fibrisolvens]|uniref:YARHG domain-containing protein n=2 Tax=Butyrivibrio fibrisolvens TaxID=831 RepID=UPI0003B54BFC|nr:YARHG domain-containing protein [Butyrivibrio fibrisolvens]
MSNSIVLILIIFYTIASLVIYHKIFTVYYFGSLTNNLLKELFGAFLAGLILTGLTLYFWWLAAIIIVLVGLGFAGKADNPQGKKVIIGVFVVFAIIVAFVGYNFKRQVEQKQEENNNNTESYNSSSNDKYDSDYLGNNNSTDSYLKSEDNYVSDENYYYEGESPDLNTNAKNAYFYGNNTINAGGVDNEELMYSIMEYYAMYYGTNNVAAEVDHETEDIVTIRLYDPYANTTSNLLGWYEYDKNTGKWKDAVTFEEIDLSEAPDAFNETLDVRSVVNNEVYIIPYSSDIMLTESDLEGLSAKELTYARNEIYARHGYVFKTSELNDYFNGMSWYLPNPNFDGTLYGVEEANTIFIKTYQEENNLQYKPQ